jgi:alpha-1,6-mannosyltransferase
MPSSTIHQSLALWRRALRRRRNWTELARFCAVGASGYAVNLAVYVTLVRGAGAHYLVAAAASFCVAVSSNYTWNRLWTFRDRRGPAARQGARFLVVSLGALALNLVVLRATVALGAARIPAQALAIVLATPVSFLGNRLWSFRAPPANVGRPASSGAPPSLAPALVGAPAAMRPPTLAGQRLTPAAALGYAALAAMLAVSGILGAGAAAGASFLVPSVHPVLPGWVAGALAGLGPVFSRGGLLIVLIILTAAYALALAVRRSLPARALIGAIVALHLVFLLAPPLLSSDIFSYLAYGRLGTVHDLSPYLYGPAAAPDDPVLNYVGWRWTYTPSAYGPLFTIGSYGLAGLGTGAALWGFKALAAIASLAVVALVSRTAQTRGRDPMTAAAVVGLNPILLVYAVGGGHNDLLMLALTMLGVLLACSARESAGAASVVAAAAVKASSIVVLPFMVLGAPRRLRALAGGLATAAGVSILGLAVFGKGAIGFVSVIAHSHLMTSTTPTGGLSALLDSIPHLRAIGLVAAAIALLGLLRAVWRGMDWISGAGWALLVVAASGGTLHAWYTIWPLPFAALSRDRRLLAATLFLQAIFVAHLLPKAVA